MDGRWVAVFLYLSNVLLRVALVFFLLGVAGSCAVFFRIGRKRFTG